jgi:hypothetical protein
VYFTLNCICRIWSIWEASRSSFGHYTEETDFPRGFFLDSIVLLLIKIISLFGESEQASVCCSGKSLLMKLILCPRVFQSWMSSYQARNWCFRFSILGSSSLMSVLFICHYTLLASELYELFSWYRKVLTIYSKKYEFSAILLVKNISEATDWSRIAGLNNQPNTNC